MRIVMITASLPPLPSGGAELQALKLGEELQKKGIAVSFLTPGKGVVRGSSEWKGMPVYRLSSVFNRSFGVLSGIKKKLSGLRKPTIQETIKIEFDDQREITNEITRKAGLATVIYYHIFLWHSFLFLWRRRRSFDIIHAHTMEWSAIVAVRLGKMLHKPVLIKDSTMNGFASLRRFPAGKKLQQLIMDNATFVAMTGAIEENMLLAGIPKEKIHRIPNGIVIADTGERRKNDLSSRNVLFVGNLYQQPAKGIDILLKAWRSVIRQFPDALLTIIGDGDIPAYVAFTEKLGINNSIKFLGKQTGLDVYFQKASLFVLPSRREGMSNALMEAMLHGLPCVATDISGNQDLIQSGRNGILVPAMDIDSLANGICFMFAHPDEAVQMGKEAGATVRQTIGMPVIAEKYISLYKDLKTE